MEVPASLFSARVPSPNGTRLLNATELSLAACVYSHSVISHDRPRCYVGLTSIAHRCGRCASVSKVRSASRVIEKLGYWKRSQTHGSWSWEVLIKPSDEGHKWVDIAQDDPEEEVEPDEGVGRIGPTPQAGSGSLGRIGPRPDRAYPPGRIGPTPQAGSGPPPRPDRAPHISNQNLSGSDQESVGFRLAHTEPQEPTRAKGACDDRQWRVVTAAYESARLAAALPTQWGPRDCDTSRRFVFRSYKAGATDEDWAAVMLDRAEKIKAGDDPKWSALATVVRKFEEYRQQAVASTVAPSKPSLRERGRVCYSQDEDTRTPEEIKAEVDAAFAR